MSDDPANAVAARPSEGWWPNAKSVAWILVALAILLAVLVVGTIILTTWWKAPDKVGFVLAPFGRPTPMSEQAAAKETTPGSDTASPKSSLFMDLSQVPALEVDPACHRLLSSTSPNWTLVVTELLDSSNPLLLNQPVNGSFETSACFLYNFTVTKPGFFRLFTEPSGEQESGADTQLYVLDRHYRLIARDDDSGISRYSRLEVPLEPDLFHVLVASFGLRTRGIFTVKAEPSATLPRPLASEKLISDAPATQGEFRVDGEDLWYSFDVDGTRDQQKIETLIGRGNGARGSGVDTVIELYGEVSHGVESALVLLDKNDDKDDASLGSVLAKTLPEGAYHLRVINVGLGSGRFGVRLTAQDEESELEEGE